MIDNLLLESHEINRIALFTDSLYRKYAFLKSSSSVQGSKNLPKFALQYKIFYPQFDEHNLTIGLLFLEKFLTNFNKPMYKIIRTTNRLASNVPTQLSFEASEKGKYFFLLNYRYATSRILRRRKLSIARKMGVSYLDYFFVDINTLYPTKEIDTYGFRPTLQIRLFSPVKLGKTFLTMFRL